VLERIGVSLTNTNLAAVYIYNLVYNIVFKLINVNKSRKMMVEVTSQRFSRGEITENNITTKLQRNGMATLQLVTQFAQISKRDFRLKRLLRHVPMSNKLINKLLSKLHFTVTYVDVTRFDIEGGTAILNVPSNPTAQNQAFVTRNMNTRMSNNVALSVNNLWQYVLLLLLYSHGDTILSSVKYNNIF